MSPSMECFFCCCFFLNRDASALPFSGVHKTKPIGSYAPCYKHEAVFTERVCMFCSVCQVPVAEGKSVQQTVDILHKKLEQLGAVKQGSFCVDCETYHATGNVSGKCLINLLIIWVLSVPFSSGYFQIPCRLTHAEETACFLVFNNVFPPFNTVFSRFSLTHLCR